jgi:adenylyltransferase/sulfurtransferase
LLPRSRFEIDLQHAKMGEPPELTQLEILRYSRHLTLPLVELAGQQRLKAARVLIIGAGGLGSPSALYLVAAGVGTLGLVDFDVVDETNLQRQLLHGTRDIGRSKLDSARERLADVNPHVHVECFETRLTSANAFELIRDFDIVIDGTDNFPTRYLTNDACVILGKPNVYGSIYRFEGQVSVFSTPDGPCYRCLIPQPPPPGTVPSCAEGGVLGVLPGLVGTIQATEAIKLILGVGETLAGRLLLIDALTMEFRTMQLSRDPSCPACGTRTIRELIDYEDFCEIKGTANDEVSVHELAALNGSGIPLQLLDVREPFEWKVARLANATLIPLGQLEARVGALDPQRRTVVYCKSGQRSAVAAEMLREAGFADVANLAGGMDAWLAQRLRVERD